MGCDIHCVTEVRRDGKWSMAYPLISKYDDEWKEPSKILLDNRDYELFGILAGVRRPVDNPIAKGRGVPEDISWDESSTNLLGDHSYSHCTLAEILAYNWTQVMHYEGWVNPVGFSQFMDEGRPRSYSGAVGGQMVQHISNREMERLIREAAPDGKREGKAPFYVLAYSHDGCDAMLARIQRAVLGSPFTLVEWERPYYEAAHEMWNKAIPEMLRLGAPDDVRLVFGFDS